MVASLMPLFSEVIFSPLWSSRHNQIAIMVSGSGVFPFPDTKGMNMAVGWYWVGNLLVSPTFQSGLTPWALLTDTFSFVLKTH